MATDAGPLVCMVSVEAIVPQGFGLIRGRKAEMQRGNQALIGRDAKLVIDVCGPVLKKSIGRKKSDSGHARDNLFGLSKPAKVIEGDPILSGRVRPVGKSNLPPIRKVFLRQQAIGESKNIVRNLMPFAVSTLNRAHQNVQH